MLRRLRLERFRGFASLEAQFRAVSAIVGKNSSGKTTVLHAIRLATEAVALALEDVELKPQVAGSELRVCSDTVVDSPRLTALSDWRELFKDGEVGEGVHISIVLEFDASDSVQEIALKLAYGRNAQLKMTLTLKSKMALEAVAGLPNKSKRRPQVLRDLLKRISPMSVFVPAFYGVTPNEEYRTRPVLRKLLGSGDQSHIVRNLVSRLDAASLNRLTAFTGRALNTVVSRRTAQQDVENQPNLEVYYRDTNGELELSSAGAGLISLIALYSAMEEMRVSRLDGESRSVVFLLDEPEAHLHPRLQGEVGEEIAKLAVEFGVQLVMATHSVEMINRLGRRQDAMLMSVDRTTSSVAFLDSESAVLDALDEFCDLTPFTSLSFLASRRILFFEGPTDVRVLEACAGVYFRSDDERMRRWRQYTQIPLEGTGNVSVRGVLAKVIDPKLFPRVGKGNVVRAALALDRDYHRNPIRANTKQVAPHLQAVDAVWSRHCIESFFLDPAPLLGWLQPYLVESTKETLEGLIAEALETTNKDEQLNEHATDERVAFHRRPDKSGRMLTEKAAIKAARDEVRSDPAAWQAGKDRASKVLAEIRRRLPPKERHRLRGSLVDLISGAPVDELGDPAALVPLEIREFLDQLVAHE